MVMQSYRKLALICLCLEVFSKKQREQELARSDTICLASIRSRWQIGTVTCNLIDLQK